MKQRMFVIFIAVITSAFAIQARPKAAVEEVLKAMQKKQDNSK